MRGKPLRLPLICLALAAAALVASALLIPYGSGAATAASTRTFAGGTVAAGDGRPWPNAHWDGLMRVNPDTAAWVRIEGTAVDYAVVQAAPDDPDRYLHRDFAGNRTPYGCPYVDADCLEHGGIDAPLVIIYGHHLINGEMFSDLARYSDGEFAREHRFILLETPQERKLLKTVAVAVVDANRTGLPRSLDGPAAIDGYLAELEENGAAMMERKEGYDQLYCFVTCSYGSSNERTLVFALH